MKHFLIFMPPYARTREWNIFGWRKKKSIEWCSHKTFDKKKIIQLYPWKHSLHNVLVYMTEIIFLMSKVLWEHHSIEIFSDHKKKFSYGSGVMKVSKSKFASVGLKTYVNDIFKIERFLWVKTHMGLPRFHFYFRTIFSLSD